MASGDSFDERLLHWIAEHRIDALTSFSTNLMHLSEVAWLSWATLVAGAAFVLYKRAWRAGAAITVAFFLGGTASRMLKDQIERTRPEFPDALVQLSGFAMPSTHASFTMAMSVALVIVVRWESKRAMWFTVFALGAAALVTGAAMVYLGAHWATDVFAGWALGAVIGTAVGWLLRPRAEAA